MEPDQRPIPGIISGACQQERNARIIRWSVMAIVLALIATYFINDYISRKNYKGFGPYELWHD